MYFFLQLLVFTKSYFVPQTFFTCYLHRSWVQSPKTLKKAFHPELSLPVITRYISKLRFQHLSFIACRKDINTSSSSLLHIQQVMWHHFLNSSGEIRFINGKLYWFVFCVASMDTIFCKTHADGCFWDIFLAFLCFQWGRIWSLKKYSLKTGFKSRIISRGVLGPQLRCCYDLFLQC